MSREDYRIQEADGGTRYFDSDDWSIDASMFYKLTKDWDITVDLFAHSTNNKNDKFYSYGKCPYTAGVDAFTKDWSGETAWTCPPTNLVIQAIKKILNTNMKAVVAVPAWRTAQFWPFLFPDGEHAIQECVQLRVVQPYLIRGQFCHNKLLQGRTSFPFVVLYVRSEGGGYKGTAGRIRMRW